VSYSASEEFTNLIYNQLNKKGFTNNKVLIKVVVLKGKLRKKATHYSLTWTNFTTKFVRWLLMWNLVDS